MIDPTKPVRQRNGMSARILATDLCSERPLAVATMDDEGEEELWQYTADGRFSERGRCPSMDLVNVIAEQEAA